MTRYTKNLWQHKLRPRKGQVAVILILVVAAALIFYAVSLNLGRMSQTKVLTTVAADTGASLLASYMASYGQSLWRTSLRSAGDGEIDEYTGVVGAIVAVVVAIIVLVVTIATAGAGGPPMATLGAAVLATVLAVVTLAIQLTVIQPGLTSAWNRQIFDLMEMRDAVVEQGIQTALRASITDSVQVPDFHDLDTDSRWGLDENRNPRDTMGRFGFYNDRQRIQQISDSSQSAILDFSKKLDEFLNQKTDGWGLYEQTAPCGTAECNPCCVPPSKRLEGIGCGSNEDTLKTCKDTSPYGSSYPWVYDAYRGNPSNTFDSFQEQLGRDDEHKDFEKDRNNPNGFPQLATAPIPSRFQLDDTTAYYSPADNRKGVFGLFYKITDWSMDIDQPPANVDDPKCHWCDVRGGTTCSPAIEHPSQLVLPVDPRSLIYNRTYCVDRTNNVPGNPPLVVDLVRLPDNDKIVAVDNECAKEARYTQVGFWRRGGDRFCSPGASDGAEDSWPYYAKCSKFETTCNESWPDDLLDNVNYRLNLFIDWALNLISSGSPADFSLWYPYAADWIEPGTSDDLRYGSSASKVLLEGAVSCGGGSPFVPCCYLCRENDGTLHVWWKDIREMLRRLKAWRDRSFAGTVCREAWCVPPDIDSSCPSWFSPSASEKATFDSNGNGTRGDMQDIVACLNWNINDTITAPNSVTVVGNAQKFEKCLQACTEVNLGITAERAAAANSFCSRLPRSLVPNFNATASFVNVTVTPLSAGSCGNTFFMRDLQQSIPEAQNQVAKFRQRHDFLRDRLAELNKLIGVLELAETKFKEFLSCPGPACELIKARIKFDQQEPGLPYHAIYGWQDKLNQECVKRCNDDFTCEMKCGRWHIVRADARIPGRCDDDCGAPYGWPKISTRENDLKTKRYYYLDNREGIVKMRVTRYDEPPPSTPLLFPNAVEIWRPSLERSDRPSRPSIANPSDLAAKCTSRMVPNPGNTTVGSKTDYYYGAFMLNKREAGIDDKCWDLANQLLTQGVTSEACARYYFQENSGMDFVFTRCGNF